MQVQVEHITKQFGAVRANNDISMAFHGGVIYAILGENGAGKSTLMKILSGFQPADSGIIRVNGTPVSFRTPETALAVGIGMLHQDPLDVPALTALDNFIFGRPKGLFPSRRKARGEFLAATERLGFTLSPQTRIERMTIGERQQLEIVRLLDLGAKLLILDEPTTGISAEQKHVLFTSLRRLAKEDGLSVILVSHKLEDVVALCDHAYVLRGGVLVGERALPAPIPELVNLMFNEVTAIPKRQDSATAEIRRASPYVFHAEGVTIAARRFVVRNLSLNAYPGEVVGLAGLDGSGQSDFLRACAGLQPLDSGRLQLHDEDITRLPYPERMRRGVAFAPAGRLEEGLVPGLTLTEHFALARPGGLWVNWRAATEQAEGGIIRYNIRGRADSPIQTLSGGNQQRTLIALLPDALKLLLLEDPTRGLDIESTRWVWQQLLSRSTSGTTIFFSSPDLDEIVAYSHRIIVFFSGQTTLVEDVASTPAGKLGELIGGNAP